MAKYDHQIKQRHIKLARMAGIIEPPDGFTDEEKAIARLMTDQTIVGIYKKLPTDRMKAICIMHFELGFTQEVVAEIMDINQSSVSWQIKMIRKVLMGDEYTPHMPKLAKRNKPKLEDVLTMFYTLHA